MPVKHEIVLGGGEQLPLSEFANFANYPVNYFDS